ncbi:Glycine betaine ABC transporter, ATP-binding protein OtaA [Olavius algarvensis associated proteobacterium Delta 3]|nr:Glycine betaine ABC transporter, ATP-binding protein OtaA [Olavius algarvensis associated proteobacterium Delta 3]
MEKIIIDNLYKIFGPNPEKAMSMLEQGLSKAEIMDKIRHGIGIANVSFEVTEGEILVVMGLSGSGKSTLVRCINRLIEPTSGRVVVNGEDVTRLTTKDLRIFRQKHFGMVFQNFALFPHRTVLRNVEYGLEIQGIDQRQRKDASMKALEQVGLKGWEDSLPEQLSGGMQQRVGLARALALDADIMLMDEAFSALDPLIRRDMQDELLELQNAVEKTIVFISHDLDEAIKLGDRIVLMKDGIIVQEGTAEEILTNPANEYVAKFVEDVDMSKILSAESVMKKSETIAYYSTDGPKAALRKMKKAGISKIFILKDKKLTGIVTAEGAAAAIQQGDRTLENILDTRIQCISPDTPAADLFPLLVSSKHPLAVVNDRKRLLGVIIKGTLLAALADSSKGVEKNRGKEAA